MRINLSVEWPLRLRKKFSGKNGFFVVILGAFLRVESDLSGARGVRRKGYWIPIPVSFLFRASMLSPKLVNMKIVIVFFIFLSLFLGMAGCGKAQESGYWRGSGSYENDHGEQYYCDSVSAELTRRSDSIEFSSVKSDCNKRYSSWGPASFKIVGKELQRGGKIVGEINPEGGGYFELVDAFQKLSVKISWELKGERLFYSEDIFTTERKHTIRASLQR
jgi:hypothetical protein